MVGDGHDVEPKTQTAIRTLIVAGYSIQGCHRQPRHIEIQCERTDILGASIPYLIALTDLDELSEAEISDIRHSAEIQNRILVIVARRPSETSISWEDFTEALGGAVPSWQALSKEYHEALVTSACNKLPKDSTGEAWLIFEDLVADGLEFIFGRRVRRLGGRKRGRAVSDMLAQTPARDVLVVDTKASDKGFDVTWPKLRPLVEYVKRQQIRQQGQVELFGVLLLSSDFQQSDDRLLKLSQQFWGEVRLPISFIDAQVLSNTVNLFRERPHTRNGMRWNQILTGGRVHLKSVEDELAAVDEERVRNGV